MHAATASTVRPPAVAGMFYPGRPDELAADVSAHLGSVEGDEAAAAARPKMLIVPHAGYVYSGPIAATAYARIARWAHAITRVVLLGPVHRVAVRGLAAPTVAAFETPLGRIALDRAAIDGLRRLPQVVHDDRPHASEHSLEVQLPFLQTVLGDGFRLVPLAVGDASPQQVAEVLEQLWGGDETLIVISSDLSHYLGYRQAQAIDRLTAQRIVALDTDLDPHEACGARALNGALRAARQHGLQAALLDLRNSGDTAGDRSRVVGYAALALSAPRAARPEDDDEAALGAALLTRARNAIRARHGLPTEAEPQHPALHQPGATFVTLHDERGALRGCIGSLQARRRLEDDVRHNALAAAFGDPRFAPLQVEEWASLQIEVSLLDAPEPLAPAATEREALERLEPGRDGLIFEWRHYRSTFLPQVWEQLPQPAQFMAALKRKAGLAPDFWAADVKLSRYRVRSFEESR